MTIPRSGTGRCSKTWARAPCPRCVAIAQAVLLPQLLRRRCCPHVPAPPMTLSMAFGSIASVHPGCAGAAPRHGGSCSPEGAGGACLADRVRPCAAMCREERARMCTPRPLLSITARKLQLPLAITTPCLWWSICPAGCQKRSTMRRTNNQETHPDSRLRSTCPAGRVPGEPGSCGRP